MFNAGDHVPVIPLVEVVGRALKLAPEHIAPTAVNVGVTFGLTVTAVTVIIEQPLTTSVASTVYVPDVVAVIEAVVAPLLQRYDVPPLAVKTTLPPEQKVNGPVGVIIAVGEAITVTTIELLIPEQPLTLSVT